jgi:hypothetical protein
MWDRIGCDGFFCFAKGVGGRAEKDILPPYLEIMSFWPLGLFSQLMSFWAKTRIPGRLCPWTLVAAPPVRISV